MNCVICKNNMTYSFSKNFDAFCLTKVDYWRCPNCGFVMSKTHADMSPNDWISLNHHYHSTYQGTELNSDDPQWLSRLQTQASVLSDAAKIGLINGDGQWLDYACGDGKLSELLKNKGHTLLKHDRYMSNKEDYLGDAEITSQSFDFVITTSVFEHFTQREQFDTVEALVSKNGVLGLHTMVCENIPCDPSWFYLLPVHCAFHTNKSMNLLFKQWGYASSVYNVNSRLWLWFKQSDPDIHKHIECANLRSNGPTYIGKNGFVDYWKK